MPPDGLVHRTRRVAGYLLSRARGESYLRYQERRYDQLWRADPEHFSSADRTFQLAYCRGHGLHPALRVLDFGCGPLAAGVHFIRFLEPGRYVAADLSAVALALGRRQIAAAGLADRRPRLVHLPAADWLGPLRGERFDLVWAQSVLTHMAPADVARLMAVLPELLTPTGCLLASFYLSPRRAGRMGARREGGRREDIKDWSYDRGTLVRLAAVAGLAAAVLDDFHHPRPYVRAGQRMAMLHVVRPGHGCAAAPPERRDHTRTERGLPC